MEGRREKEREGIRKLIKERKGGGKGEAEENKEVIKG